jgi:hypothetical protein
MPKSGRPAIGHLGGYPILWAPSKNTGTPRRVDPVWSFGDKVDRPARICLACEHALPPAIGILPIDTIGIVGTPSAGKSHYIAIGLPRMGRDLRRYGFSNFAGTEETENYLERYRSRLLEGEVLDKTAPTVSADVRFSPLVYDVTYGGEQRQLLMHDIAGEQFTNQEWRDEQLPFLQRASGLIFLIDALDFTSIREHLDVVIAGPSAGLDRQARLIRAVADDFSIVPGRLESVPVAFAINKSDLVFDALGRIEDALHSDADSADDHESTLDNLGRVIAQNVVRCLDDGELESAINRFYNYSLHLVATLGVQPVDGRQFARAEPRRLADPMFSVLKRMFTSQAVPRGRPWQRVRR